ncbi:MAG TPA: hypothetical protein VGA61_08905 [Anaerolineae bacterium]
MRRVLWAMLAAGAVAIFGAAAAYADQPGTAAVTLVPAEGRGAGARLRAQTVDVTVAEDKSGLWADTRVWYQMSNPLTRPVTLTLALPGPQLTPGELPANLQLKLGEMPLAMQPAGSPASSGRVLVPLDAQESAGLLLTYRQALPEAGGRAVYAYPLAAASAWGGAPESLRVTVNFATAPAPEQLLGMTPEPSRAGSQTLVWSWDSKAAPDIWLAFLRPSWWTGFSAARAAAGAATAQPADHLALSRLYQQLAGLPPLGFLPDLDFYTRYYPPAVAELQAATAAPATNTAAAAADQATAHSALARLYRDQANRLGNDGGGTYLELAAAEAQAALAGGVSDPGLKSLASDAYLRLAAAARGRGDMATADGYLAKLAALEPASRASTAAEEQKAARLALAAQQISRGSFETARQIVTESYGRDAVDIPALAAPLARQMLASVQTTVTVGASSTGMAGPLGGQRKITLTFVDSRDPAGLLMLIAQVGEAWRPVGQATFTSGSDWLAASFNFADDRSLGEIQTRLARLLPADAELALLESVLSPEMLSLRTGQDQFQRSRRYLESVDLVAVSDAWQSRASEIRQAGKRLAARPTAAATLSGAAATAAGTATPAPTTPQDAEAVDLGQVQLALWGANAQSWESLAGHSYARYTVSFGNESVSREWQVPAGMRRDLDAQTASWRSERLAILAAFGLLGVLLVAYAVWRII